MKIQLLPKVENSASVKSQLNDVLHRCDNVKGAVAYWTLNVDYLRMLCEKLTNKNSFFCVDLHLPTDVEKLANFVNQKANIFLHDYQLTVNIGQENRQPALLHTKILHFEFQNGHTETWIGSHNFTRRALDGINFEASTIITTENKTDEEKSFVQDVLNYLQLIKDNCIPFNPDDIDFYKSLQGENGNEDEVDVIEMVGKDISKLSNEKTIQIISKDISNFDRYKLVNKKVILHCFDLETLEEHIFQTIILNAGTIDTFNEKSYEMTFSERRYAIREKNMLPYLQYQNIIDQNLLKISQYYINLYIEKELLNFKIYEKPAKKEEFWDYLPNSAHTSRMTQEGKKELFPYQKLPIKKANRKTISPKQILLSQIITNRDQKYLIDYFEYNSKYKESEYVDNEISKSIERKQLFVKRIIKRIEEQNR